MSAASATAIRVIDADTHLTEPVDLWTARIPARFRDRAPRVALDDTTGAWRWQIGDRWGSMVGNYSVAGWHEFPPSCPPTLEQADPAAYDAAARIAHMDANGIYAQVLYPNVGGFGSQNFLELEDEELKLLCVTAYNDFLLEWAASDPTRLLPVVASPFWDIDATVKEV